MKPELAVLPMDVWADVFVYPWITRQQLAQIVYRFKERAFAEKLQTFLHDPKCGKHSFNYLIISYKKSDKLTNKTKYYLRKRKTPQYQTTLAVALYPLRMSRDYKNCEFPGVEMPENIISFKRLTIGHLNDEVLDFLDKIKPLFTDVFLDMSIFLASTPKNVRIFFGRFFSMLVSIRGIRCSNQCINFLGQHFNETLALTKQLDLHEAEMAFIPTYLNWLNTPLNFHVDGPRFLQSFAKSETIFAIVDAVRKQFLAATTTSTFVIFLKFYGCDEHQIGTIEEFNIENAITKEQLVVQSASFAEPAFGEEIYYAEIMRHPTGAHTEMQDWIKEHAFKVAGEEGKHIWIKQPTIGRITKKGDKTNQDGEAESDDDDQDEAGPSTSAKMMKK